MRLSDDIYILSQFTVLKITFFFLRRQDSLSHCDNLKDISSTYRNRVHFFFDVLTLRTLGSETSDVPGFQNRWSDLGQPSLHIT